MDEEQLLLEWADKIVRLDVTTVDVLVRMLRQLSKDQRLKSSDREFAESQVRSIMQARKRAKRHPKPTE